MLQVISLLNRIQLKAWTFQLNIPGVSLQCHITSEIGIRLQWEQWGFSPQCSKDLTLQIETPVMHSVVRNIHASNIIHLILSSY